MWILAGRARGQVTLSQAQAPGKDGTTTQRLVFRSDAIDRGGAPQSAVGEGTAEPGDRGVGPAVGIAEPGLISDRGRATVARSRGCGAKYWGIGRRCCQMSIP